MKVISNRDSRKSLHEGSGQPVPSILVCSSLTCQEMEFCLPVGNTGFGEVISAVFTGGSDLIYCRPSSQKEVHAV